VITLDDRSGVIRQELSQVYYVKKFVGPGGRLKFLLRISRYHVELRNLQFFSRLGLAIPNIVARGYESRMGLMQRAVIVTAAVADSMDLEQFIATGRFYEDGVGTARQLLSKLAHATRLLHANGFYHKDMKIRNVLVQKRAREIELFFLDCPSGYRPPRVMLRRGIVRDLASLARGLRGVLSPRDLLYFFKQYRGCSRLGPADKALARDALAYHRDRRMTRKRRRWEAKKSRQRALERQSALVAADSHER